MTNEYYVTPTTPNQRLTRLLDGFGQRLSTGIWRCCFTDEQIARICQWHGERLKIEKTENQSLFLP